MEDHHERAAALHHFLPRIQRQQHCQGADVENQDAVDHLIGGARNAVLGVVGFGGGDPHQFQAAKGKHDHRQRHHQAADAIGEEAAVLPQVGHAGIRPTVTADQQVATKGDHADDGHHLDQGKPELHLAVDFHLAEVDQVDHGEEDGRRRPGRKAGPPVLDIDPHGSQFGHADQHIQHPVVPAGHEPGELAPVAVGKMTEGAGHRLLDHHLTQLAHDEKGNQAGNCVTQQHGRAGQLDGLGNTEEQTGANRATQRNQLDMAIFQPAV
ncbi:hypothetical protein D3C77_352160 [compost metagenome]